MAEDTSEEPMRAGHVVCCDTAPLIDMSSVSQLLVSDDVEAKGFGAATAPHRPPGLLCDLHPTTRVAVFPMPRDRHVRELRRCRF